MHINNTFFQFENEIITLYELFNKSIARKYNSCFFAMPNEYNKETCRHLKGLKDLVLELLV